MLCERFLDMAFTLRKPSTACQITDFNLSGYGAHSGARPINVCFTPKSGHWLSVSACALCAKSRHEQLQQNGGLLDHLIGGHLHDLWNCQAERLGGLEIDDEFDFRGLLHRKLGRLIALEDAIDIEGRLPELVVYVRSIREE